MQPRFNSLLLFSCVLFAHADAADAQTFTPLGDLPGGVFRSEAAGISSDGTTVVGISASAVLPEGEAFVWDAVGGMQGLGELASALPPANRFSRAFGASDDGSLVVGQSSSDDGPVGFTWDATNGMLRLGEGGSVIMGASDDGTIVVGTDFDSVEGRMAARWDLVAGTRDLLGDLPGGPVGSDAVSVSSDGSVVVGWSFSTQGDEAFIWDALNGMQGLGTLPGVSPGSQATGISGDGATVVGWSGAGIPEEAFIWDATNGMQGLGFLPGGFGFDISRATGVSADGSVVVGFAAAPSGFGFEAFVWDATNGMQSLAALLSAGGVDLTGYQLYTATGVSADGNTIAGIATNPSGDDEAFVATLPEPGFGIGAALGTMILAAFRRRTANLGTPTAGPHR